jgi:hypothetical protein
MKTLRATFVAITLPVLTSMAHGQVMPGMSPPWASQMPTQKPGDPQQSDQQDKMRKIARQKRLLTDTDRLASLSAELKAQVEKSGTDTLSMEEIKKAGEIEKLANEVKNRLKGGN